MRTAELDKNWIPPQNPPVKGGLVKVFVYGTLKSGYGNNRLLKTSTFLGEAVLPDHIAYYYGSIGSFPFVVKNKGTSVTGEVYEVDQETLQSLDYLEGYREHSKSNFYDRTMAIVDMQDGSKEQVFYYLGHKDWLANPIEVFNRGGVYSWNRSQ